MKFAKKRQLRFFLIHSLSETAMFLLWLLIWLINTRLPTLLWESLRHKKTHSRHFRKNWRQWNLQVTSKSLLYFRSSSALYITCLTLRKPWYTPSLFSALHRIREKMNVRSQWVVATYENYQEGLSPRQTHWPSTELMALSVNRRSVLWTGAHMNLQALPL